MEVLRRIQRYEWAIMILFGIVSTIKHHNLANGVQTMLLYFLVTVLVHGVFALIDSISNGDWE